jgi:hypothetical protein
MPFLRFLEISEEIAKITALIVSIPIESYHFILKNFLLAEYSTIKPQP